MTTGLPQLRSVSMRESVGEALRKALYDGRFQAGQPLSEAALAAEMGISRGPVREALLLLIQDGLVTHSPNRGFYVIQLTATDLREISEVRLPLESAALAMAQPNVSSDDLSKLEKLRDKMIETHAAREILLCGKCDMEFHSLIWDRTGNSRLAATMRHLLAPMFAYGAFFSVGRPDLTPQLLAEEHDLFIRFLRGRADRSAEQCVRFHLGL
jgi:DNA-binding GntR family transcriptional regulator